MIAFLSRQIYYLNSVIWGIQEPFIYFSDLLNVFFYKLIKIIIKIKLSTSKVSVDNLLNLPYISFIILYKNCYF